MSLAWVRLNKKTKFILKISLAFYILLFAIVIVLSNGIAGKRLVFNITESLDGYIYLIDENNKTVSKGNIVAFYAPDNPFYKKNKRFLKVVWGEPGDIVTFDKDGKFFINGKYKGIAKTATDYNGGAKLIHAKGGVIEPNRYFMGTDNPGSFDSRYKYIGNIDEKNIIGNAKRIL